MTPRQIFLVRRSFERVKPMASEAGRLCYDRLFTGDPSLRRMFRGALACEGIEAGSRA